MTLNEERKNYAVYKDGLPIVNLTKKQVKDIANGFCVRGKYLSGGKKLKIRVRLKPKRKLTLIQENAKLRRLLKQYQEGKIQKEILPKCS